MTLQGLLESAGVLLTVMAPLVAVPLTLITFYLRSLREHQLTLHAQVERRVTACETGLDELRRRLAEVEREYTTKEEWLRESLHARQVLEQLRGTGAKET